MEHESEVKEMLISQKKFLKDCFGLRWSCVGAVIPKRELGFDRLLVAPKGLSLKEILRASDDLMHTMSAIDLDGVESIRRQDCDDIVWARDSQEADEEFDGLSPEDVRKMGYSGITLDHRMLFGMKYFLETGQHLDLASMTLCSGSRYGNIWTPDVCYMTHLVMISETHFEAVRPGRRVRRVITV